MRRSAALAAAALLAFVLSGAGCEPSSLTPFGIDTRQPEDTGVNGFWQGVNSTGQPISFQVGSDAVTFLHTTHLEVCKQTLSDEVNSWPVIDNAFKIDGSLDPQGHLVLQGVFTSDTTCSGSYFFEGLSSAAGCPTSGSGTFTASKVQ